MIMRDIVSWIGLASKEYVIWLAAKLHKIQAKEATHVRPLSQSQVEVLFTPQFIFNYLKHQLLFDNFTLQSFSRLELMVLLLEVLPCNNRSCKKSDSTSLITFHAVNLCIGSSTKSRGPHSSVAATRPICAEHHPAATPCCSMSRRQSNDIV